MNMSFFKKLKEKITKQTESVTEKFKEGLSKTRNNFSEKVNDLVSSYRKVDEDFFEELEEILIQADVGFDTVMTLIDELKNRSETKKYSRSKRSSRCHFEKLVEIYESGEQSSTELNIQENELTVILFVGVNGVGKTTTIGKLAYQFKTEGKKVVMAAGDTFSAGAIEQLEVWGERVGVDVIKQVSRIRSCCSYV